MPRTDNLLQLIQTTFSSALGTANGGRDREDHWSIKPSPTLPAINVLVNHSDRGASIWVFDPNTRNDGVVHATINNEGDVQMILDMIKRRVETAVSIQQSRAAKLDVPR